MAWTSASTGLLVTDGGAAPTSTTDVPLTSTATLLMTAGGMSWLRMYGVSFDVLQNDTTGGTPFTNPQSTCATTSPWALRYPSVLSNQQYVESSTWVSTAPFVSPILVDKRSDVVYNTCIWKRRQSASMQVQWERLLDAQGTTDRVTSAPGSVTVVYKDLDVVKLPNGAGYLMVLARYLADAAIGGLDPTNSRGDIVAWWSDTPDFSGDEVVGPLLLVDGMQAWSTKQSVRIWVGVPGVEVIQDDEGEYQLYLYYSVQECGLGYNRGPLGKKSSELYDNLNYTAYRAGLTAIGFEVGVAVKRIALSDLSRMLFDEWNNYYVYTPGVFTFTDEDVWPGSSVIDGELLGPVRLWFFDGPIMASLAYPVRSFFADYASNEVQLQDPSPATCGSSIEDLSLYLAVVVHSATSTIAPYGATSSALGSGHGLWRARAVPDGTVFYEGSKRIVATAGKDFICASQRTSPLLKSPDQLVESIGLIFMDPDPVWTGRSWWVATGGQDAAALWLPAYLYSVQGNRFDGCATWVDAYDPAYAGPTPRSPVVLGSGVGLAMAPG